MLTRDTIAAIATPPGVGGIGILRISGPDAEALLRRLFRPRRDGALSSHRLRHGDLVDPASGEVLDEVLAVFMRGPHSYTGEDAGEIHCHGGPVLLQRAWETALREGSRPARPGEFTERAFLNDRLDLSQAEAVQDLIMAPTPRAAALALTQLQGGLGAKIRTIREGVLEILSGIEAAIDFPDEDLGEDPAFLAAGRLPAVREAVAALLETWGEGRIHRHGARIVITGKPNVGKSSLLNSLLGTKRAIVTSVPGTTRDFIEESVVMGGIPVVLTDTAGVRTPGDAVEGEGVALVWERLAEADGVLVVLDGSCPLTREDREVLAGNRQRPCLVAINKADLPPVVDEAAVLPLLPPSAAPPLWISAKYGQGLDDLREALRALATRNAGAAGGGDLLLTNVRHKAALEKTKACLEAAEAAIAGGRGSELAAVDLREALDFLGEITGETVGDDVLSRIFSRFCIGK